MRRIKAKLAVLVVSLFGLALLSGGCATQSGSTGAAEPQGQAESLVSIDNITSSETADATIVTVSADGPLTFSSFKKPDPLSVVLVFPATTTRNLGGPPELGSDLIDQVLVGDGNAGRTARVEFQLAADTSYTARKAGNTVLLTFSRPEGVSPAARASVSENAAPEVAAASVATPEMAPSPVSQQPASAAVTSYNEASIENTTSNAAGSQSAAWVNKIDFLSQSEGKSTLVLGTTHAIDYRINKINPTKLEIQLLNTRIPSYRQRALITTRFNSAVDRIVPYQVSQETNETRVSIEMREAVPYAAEQTGNMLLVHFEASSVPPKPMEQAQLPAWKREMTAPMADTGDMAGAAPVMATPAGAGTAAAMQPMPQTKGVTDAELEAQLMEDDLELKALLAPRRKNYTGEKIALDFYDTDIKNVFRILREISGKNFAIDKDVTGKVTMTLDKPVPWDQVLDLVLRMNQLGMTHEGEIVRIATLETLKKEDDLKKAKLEALRKAREEVKALEPLVTKYIPISYSSADAEVKPHIEQILTAGRGSVTVDSKNNQVIVTDTAAKVRQAESIVRRIDKVTAQVIIEARVVEVSKDFSKELGIDWDFQYGPGIMPGTDWNTTTDMAMNFPSASSSSIGLSFSRLSGVPFVLNARLNALETTGEGRILSAPKILTLDNKKAKIKQGLEFAYLERDSSGGSSVAFKNIDLLLEVTPHVTPDNRISLMIFITKNDVAGITAGVPNVATNEAETELLVNDGDTVVIGGIVKRTENRGTEGFPVLSKIPFIGWAFKNDTRSTQDDELLIFITPRIVQLEQEVAQSIN
jgi:type IV pilus assembly protein PilQ